jgi:hypothetical protein
MPDIITEMVIGMYIVSCMGIDCAIIAQDSNHTFPHDILSGLTLIMVLILSSITLEYVDELLSP